MSPELARAIDLLTEATRIVARLRVVAPIEEYSQDNPPPGMSKRTYLDHCYAGHWASRKQGRLRLTAVSDFESWRSQHPLRKARTVEAVEQIDDDAAFVASGGKKGRR